jgi:hypothetical protein
MTGGDFTRTVQIYDPVAGSWSLGAPMPTRRIYLAAAALPVRFASPPIT